MVSIRFRVNGPVSSIFCPLFPSAQQWRTPRGPNRFLNSGSFLIVGILRFFFRVKVIEIAGKFVEAMHCRQEFIFVTQMVLANLSDDVAMRLEQLGYGRIVRKRSISAPGMPTLVRPVRIGFWPVIKAARPAVQLC